MPQQEDRLLYARFEEIAAACRAHRPTFFGFLDEREAMLLSAVRQPPVRVVTAWGGRENADRVMLGVFDESDYCSDPDPALVERKRRSAFPIVRLRVDCAGAQRHFTEPPTHRDYLGALMGLGLTRRTVGDIVCDETGAWLWCDEKTADFIVQNLRSVGRNGVSCVRETQKASETVGNVPESDENPASVVDLPTGKCYNDKDWAEQIEIGVASPRLDALLTGLIHASRGRAEQLLLSGAVRYGYQECTQKDHPVGVGDTFSVRGVGKYRVLELNQRGKKGRTYILLGKYR